MVGHSLNEYFLGSHLKPKPEHSDCYHIRPINAADMNSISTALKQLGDFESYCSLYEICEKNYQSILSYHSTIKENFPLNRDRSYEYVGEVRQEINRLLLNYLSSFRTFIDHLGTKYKVLKRRQGYSFFDEYEKIKSACEDSSFSYRFFTKLRNYVQHCGLPLGEVMIYEQLTQDGNVDIHVSTSLHRDSLLSNYNWWKEVKADLQSQPEYMELLLYLDEFQHQIQHINWLVADFEISLAADSWQILWELISEVHALYTNGSPFIGQYKKTDGGQKKVLITHFPIHTMLRFEEKLSITNNSICPTARSVLNKIKLNTKNYIGMYDILTIHQTNEKPQ